MVHRILNGTERFQRKLKSKYNTCSSIPVRSKPTETCKKLTCVQVIVRIYMRKITHLKIVS